MATSSTAMNMLTDGQVFGSGAAAAPAPVSDEEIFGAPQISGPWRIPALTASNIAQGAASVAAIPGNMQNLLDYALNKVDGWIVPGSKPIWTRQAMQQMGNSAAVKDTIPQIVRDVLPGPLPDSSDVNAFGKRLGLWDRPDLQPQTTAEKYLASGAMGVGASIPLLMSGGMDAVPSLAAGLGSGIGSQAGHDLWPSHPTLGSISGAFLGGGLASGALGASSRIANAALGNGNEMMDAYKAAGVTPRLVGDVTQKPTLQSLQAYASKTPLGVGRIAEAANETAHEFGNSVENIAASLGTSQTPQDVGTALQGASARWMQNFKAQNSSNWNALDNLIPNGVDTTNYRNALDGVLSSLKGAPQTAKALQSGFAQQLSDALNADTAATGGTLPWSDVKGIRSLIGERLEDPNLPADAGTAELKRIYGGLTKDMQTAAANSGPQAQQAFSDANAYTSQGHQFIDGILRPMIRQGQTPEGAAQTVLGKLNRGGSVIGQLRSQMPDAADEVAAYKIRDMGAATAGRQNAAGNAVSPSSFLTDWNNLSPEAKTALFQDPQTQAKLNALAKISEGIKETLSKVNSSNTAAHSDWSHLFGTMKDVGIGALAGHAAGGESGMMTGAALGLGAPIAGYFAARGMSSPALTSYFAAPSVVDPVMSRLATGLTLNTNLGNKLTAPVQ